MATDERKDREHEDRTRKDENMKDLSAKRPDPEKEEQVKGGGPGLRPTADLE